MSFCLLFALIRTPSFEHGRFVNTDRLFPSLFNAFLIYKYRDFLYSKLFGFMNLQPETPMLSYFKRNTLFFYMLFKEMLNLEYAYIYVHITGFFPMESGCVIIIQTWWKLCKGIALFYSLCRPVSRYHLEDVLKAHSSELHTEELGLYCLWRV